MLQILFVIFIVYFLGIKFAYEFIALFIAGALFISNFDTYPNKTTSEQFKTLFKALFISGRFLLLAYILEKLVEYLLTKM